MEELIISVSVKAYGWYIHDVDGDGRGVTFVTRDFLLIFFCLGLNIFVFNFLPWTPPPPFIIAFSVCCKHLNVNLACLNSADQTNFAGEIGFFFFFNVKSACCVSSAHERPCR